MTLQQAASSLYKSLQNDPAFFTVGVAEKGEFNPESHLVIYLKKQVRTAYPTMYEGFPVRVTVSGPWAPLVGG